MSVSFPYFSLARERGLRYADVLSLVDDYENGRTPIECMGHPAFYMSFRDMMAIGDAVRAEWKRRGLLE